MTPNESLLSKNGSFYLKLNNFFVHTSTPLSVTKNCVNDQAVFFLCQAE